MKALFLSLSLLLLTGCASMMGGSRNIDQGIYHGKIGGVDNPQAGFSVKVMQMVYDRAGRIQVKEEKELDVNYVSFSSTGVDFSIYRVMAGKRMDIPFSAYKQHFPNIMTVAEQGYNQPIKKIYSTETTFQGRPAMYAVFTQEMPSRFDPLRMHKIAGDTLTHAVYMIYYEKDLVVLWGQYSANGLAETVTDQNRQELVKRTFKPMNEFVNSFKLHHPS